MAIRTINSPGVQINEIDKSQTTPAIVGTGVLVMGFAPAGEEYTPVELVSISDLQTNFGTPLNEAERYFYYTCKEVIDGGGVLTAIKLPYNNTICANYRGIGLTIGTGATTISSDTILSGTLSAFTTGTLSGAGITSYVACSANNNGLVTITTSVYDAITAGGDITGAGAYDFIIINEKKAQYGGAKETEGLFVSIVDSVDGLKIQRALSSNDNDDIALLTGVRVQSGTASYTVANAGILSGSTFFIDDLTAAFKDSSVSEAIMTYFPTIEYINDGAGIDTTYNHYITVVVGKTVADYNFEGKLKVTLLEAFTGSIYADTRNSSTGQSVYIGDIVNARSDYIKMYGRTPQSGSAFVAGLANNLTNSVLYFEAEPSYLLSFTAAEAAKVIQGGALTTTVRTALEKVANIDERQIDLIVDGGLSTIGQFTDDVVSGTTFLPEEDTDSTDANKLVTSTDAATWRAVCTEIETFCRSNRKDCMAILDIPRNVVIDGKLSRIRKTAPSNTFSSEIAPQLKYLTGLNSSYAALYSNWQSMVDGFSGKNVWMPPSTKTVGVYLNTDRVANIWDAPAGLNRGILRGINQLAINPASKEADQLYLKSINYGFVDPTAGFVLEGQKTTQVKPSAFDRVNVRRLFLRLERLTRQTMRYFVDEPNNFFTRRRAVSSLEPVFARVKAQGGLYDYMIVCDESNNTAEVIDNNELRMAILLKPVKTAEFIVVDFIAAKTSDNFTELL